MHVDYAELLWEGLHYSLMHQANFIPYPRFTKIIIDYYITEHPEILRRVHDNYHRVENDDLVKNIFNSGKNKDVAGMKVPDWMLTVDMKLTAHYRMYNAVFRHLEDEELDHLLEGNENVYVDEFVNDIFNSQEDSGTRIEPRSDKESPEAEIDADMVPVNSNEDGEESVGDEFELKRRENGKEIYETRDTPPPTPIRSTRTHIAPLSTDKEILKELAVNICNIREFSNF
ncbi:hypothetical protein Tco_0185900 [Tanacetum coccineum]